MTKIRLPFSHPKNKAKQSLKKILTAAICLVKRILVIL